jgi:hypothetical protein
MATQDPGSGRGLAEGEIESVIVGGAAQDVLTAARSRQKARTIFPIYQLGLRRCRDGGGDERIGRGFFSEGA